ncbi:MAG TPA: DMT family transporter [Casimicrobiaceae bacterium]|nr:DMT family transporter [Casimicrobiaceae bacterium]
MSVADPNAASADAVGHVPLTAIALVCAATLCFATLDSVIKQLSQWYPVTVLMWARWTMQTVVLVIWLAPKSGFALLRTQNLTSQLFRAGILVSSSLCFMNALKSLPLAEATALNYSTPALVTIMAVVFLDERMTPMRVGFVIAGLLGMLLIVRPGSGLFQGAALFAIGSAWFYATFQIVTRRLVNEDWRSLLFYPGLVGAVAMSVIVPYIDWPESIPWQHALSIVAVGLIGTLGHFLFLRAFLLASASSITPFTYVHLVWATLIGWIAFGSFPDALSLAGMAIIAGSGLLITLHERRKARSAMLTAPTAVD